MNIKEDLKAELGAGVYHPGARPMKLVRGPHGEWWLCDKIVDPEKDLKSQGCWLCGSRAFTRND